MSSPLAGRRAFEAMGRRDASNGLPLIAMRAKRRGWPRWAQEAFAFGWLAEKRNFAADMPKGEKE